MQYQLSTTTRYIHATMKSLVFASAMLLWLAATTAQAQTADYDFIIVGGV
jgi:hypothetical protein